jgi:hypothetical protein
MQTKFKSRALGIALLVSSLGFFAFTSKFGGDGFEVWINNKMVLQQYFHGDQTVKNIALQESNYNDKISFKYSHCGNLGKGRSITLKNADEKVLKQLNFSDGGKVMTFDVKDIMEVQKNANTVIRIYYASREIPAGKLLVSMSRGNTGVASK